MNHSGADLEFIDAETEQWTTLVKVTGARAE